jgi:hypothetical protein
MRVDYEKKRTENIELKEISAKLQKESMLLREEKVQLKTDLRNAKAQYEDLAEKSNNFKTRIITLKNDLNKYKR